MKVKIHRTDDKPYVSDHTSTLVISYATTPLTLCISIPLISCISLKAACSLQSHTLCTHIALYLANVSLSPCRLVDFISSFSLQLKGPSLKKPYTLSPHPSRPRPRPFPAYFGTPPFISQMSWIRKFITVRSTPNTVLGIQQELNKQVLKNRLRAKC